MSNGLSCPLAPGLEKPTGKVTLFAFSKGEGLSEHTAPFDALAKVIEGLAPQSRTEGSTPSIAISGQAHRVQGGEIILKPAGVPSRRPNGSR